MPTPPTITGRPVPPLVPPEVAPSLRPLVSTRPAWATVVVVGLGMASWMLFPRASWDSVLVYGTFFMLVLGWLTPILTLTPFEWTYDEQRRAPAPRPPGEWHRALPASRLLRGGFSVAGTLYLGPGRLHFATHPYNFPGQGTPFVLDLREPAEASRVERPLTRTQRLVVRSAATVPVLRLAGTGGTADFIIPDPDIVVPLLNDAMDEMRAAAGEAALPAA